MVHTVLLYILVTDRVTHTLANEMLVVNCECVHVTHVALLLRLYSDNLH